MKFSPSSDFASRAEAMGIVFDDGDVERLGHFLEMLLEANERFNLTAITEPDQAWTRHVLDSLTLLPLIVACANEADRKSATVARVMDVGSGGGLPGVPLAIVLGDVQFTLLEATGKKARFLQEVVAALGLTNVRILNERAETAGADGSAEREQYDVVLARAVGRLPVLLELCVPFVKVGGLVLAMKGAQAEQEIVEAKPALHLLHAQVIDKQITPTGTIVVIEKRRATPRAYPRSPGDPKRSPLGMK